MGLWHRVLLGNVAGDFLKENLTNWTFINARSKSVGTGSCGWGWGG